MSGRFGKSGQPEHFVVSLMYEAVIERMVVEPGHATYAIDDGIVVAAVQGQHVRLYDGDGLAEEYDCESPEAAEQEALRYALFLQRPPEPPGEAS